MLEFKIIQSVFGNPNFKRERNSNPKSLIAFEDRLDPFKCQKQSPELIKRKLSIVNSPILNFCLGKQVIYIRPNNLIRLTMEIMSSRGRI